MGRRSKLTPTIPHGFAPHDGSGCPVDEDSRPATFRRMGTKTRAGFCPARDWMIQASDPWIWHPDDPGPMDIIAYREEADVD